MKTLLKALAFTVCTLPLLASAGNKIATGAMQVSFTVTESCAVQSGAAASGQRPAVSCQLNTPYQVNRGADKAAATPSAVPATVNGAAIRTETSPQDWTIYF